MADSKKYAWPEYRKATLLGTEVDRLDGLEKAAGTAKYAYDINPPKMCLARVLGSSVPHGKLKTLDVEAAKKVPGVLGVYTFKKVGDEVNWHGDLVACVAGETEGAIGEGLAAIKVEYDALPFFVNEEDLAAAEKAGRTKAAGSKIQLAQEPPEGVDDEKAWQAQEIERLLKESAAVVEGYYGIQAITHMCLEPHGSTCEWNGGKLTAHLSTQNVSGTAAQFASPLKLTSGDVTVHCDFIGGGFGSKFAADEWGVMCAKISQDLGRPVKLMLDRDLELKSAGNRPSGFIQVKVGADKDGVVQVWDSKHWGTGGFKGGTVSQGVVPYVFEPKNFRRSAIGIATETDNNRAWRAPNHPQACAMTQTAYDDLAHKLGLDSYDVFLRNLPSVSNDKADVYAKQMEIAARLIDWKKKWHPHGKGPAKGSIVNGLGMAIHTWGGGGHGSTCNLKIHPDGGVEISLGSQDLGTGTRTAIGIVVAETLGLPLSAVKVNIGSSSYANSGPSGGSTTIGGVSESTRRASQDALAQLAELVAKKLGIEAGKVVAKEGKLGDGSKSLAWKEACSLLGMNALEVKGEFKPGRENPLSSSGVAGVQMAEVAVDRDTGVVKIAKFVAVQDMGTIINRQTATSQIYGALIMGLSYALFEERIMDAKTGAFINAELSDYKLPRLGDIGELVVELYEPEEEYKRGVIGLGEPPVIAPGAAISNAVCNALGVRVPVLPLTPKRVLDAIAKAKA